MTCDSIGLFLETECQFPLESEEDCYEEHEFVPSYRRQGCGLTMLFVNKVSVELIDLYRCFVSPASPLFCCSFLLPPFGECWIASSKGRSVDNIIERCLEDPVLAIFLRLIIYGFYVFVPSPPPVHGSIVLGAYRYDPLLSCDSPSVAEKPAILIVDHLNGL